MSYWQHRIKCTQCGLHFIVCSDHEDWPDQNFNSPRYIYCPECGKTAGFLKWSKKVEGFIFEAVPGDAGVPVFR